MRFGFNGFAVLTFLALTGCATSRPTVSNNSSINYNSYNEDLAATRPVYNASPAGRSPTATRPATPAPVSPPATASPRKNDVSKPAVPVEALHVNRKLDMVIDTLAVKNRAVRYAPGYRIQVYVGNQRQEIDKIKLLIYQNFPELSPYLTYNQPTYKLKVGDFMRRIDAERYYASIRQLLPSSQLQPDKVEIRRSLSIK
ncbi:SPOR domain-containing protein [Spirosoma sp. RP8]|uniref:SPOR domain-containing protein n=1 Tax=Spirosoma liriopis TaxID=2937440 RepID=A0ABT0HIA6_9BACT|nr:SPOR domain-containing protein [Spirosoma liriopis]MCK8491891.1 SPOR domain-containing protein [Spirosoma liriopis]